MGSADRWQRIESLYHAARELHPGERPGFLAEACAGDLSLKSEIESLLAQSVSAEDTGAVAALLDVGAQTGRESASSSLLGQRFGVYQVTARLGAGGMGEVYRARDTKLGREVAIKVLPRAFSADPERLARFEREARVLASLNHPNIATIFGVEEMFGVHAIVMELVEGETLAGTLRPGRAMSLDRALTVVQQICDALAAAHERGIVHRDLKPANIAISRDGRVKVLDFGLARVVRPQAGSEGESRSPTVTVDGTREGTIMGTAAYMSPEQARGEIVDKRADIWAFGCIFFEMLTGRPLFGRPTLSDTIAAVLEREPDWQTLPPGTPVSVHRLLRRCLRKDARRRLHDIADARLELEEVSASASDATPQGRDRDRTRRFVLSAMMAAALVAAVAVLLWRRQPSANETGPVATGPMIQLTSDSGLTTDPTISADGRLTAYASDRAGEGNLDIWVQQTAGGPPIRLTADATDDHEPSLAPDGNLVAFRSERDGGGVFVATALGGDARLIAPGGHGPNFSPDGQFIAFWTGPWLATRAVQMSRQTYVVPVAGGEPVQVASELTNAGDPVWSPDGKSMLVFGRKATSGAEAEADWWWVPRDGREATRSGAYERMRAVGILTPPPGGSDFPYPASWTKWGVLFAATTGSGDARNIWTLPVDTSGRAVGNPRQITAGPTLAASAAASRDGHVVFSDLVQRAQLLLLPLEANAGRVTGALTPLRTDAARVATRATASQDGRLLAFGILKFAGSEVWTRDLHTGRERQLAAIPLASLNPLISPAGRTVAYTAIAEEQGASGGLGAGYVIGAGGAAPRQVCDRCEIIAFTDDQHVLIETQERGVWLLDVNTRERVLAVPGGGIDPRISWDQRWIGFVRDDMIYVAPFSPGAAPRGVRPGSCRQKSQQRRPGDWMVA